MPLAIATLTYLSTMVKLVSEPLPRGFFEAIPGYPFLPCPICVREGFKGEEGCDHSVPERARAMHPGLVLTASTDRGRQ